jgi:hypothetical protein
MPDGVIVGGWPHVIAAYGLTAVVLIGFGLRLISKLRQGRDKD